MFERVNRIFIRYGCGIYTAILPGGIVRAAYRRGLSVINRFGGMAAVQVGEGLNSFNWAYCPGRIVIDHQDHYKN